MKGTYIGTREPTQDDISPLRWAIFTMWKREDGDASKEYQMFVSVVSPSGRKPLEAVTKFRLDKDTHRHTIHVPGVPIGEPGIWTLKLFLAESDQAPMDPIATYEMPIEFERHGIADSSD
jgi:hypothetical protein